MGLNDCQLCVPADGPALRPVPPLNTALAINNMWPFRKKPFLPEEYSEWQFQTYAWLFRNFEGYERFRNTRLITPTAEFFPATDLKGHAFFEFMFGLVKKHADMPEWPCKLEAQEPDELPVEVQPGVALKHDNHSPCGTFTVPEPGQPAIITYNLSAGVGQRIKANALRSAQRHDVLVESLS